MSRSDLVYLEYLRALEALARRRRLLEHHWRAERMEAALEPERRRDAEFRAGVRRVAEFFGEGSGKAAGATPRLGAA